MNRLPCSTGRDRSTRHPVERWRLRRSETSSIAREPERALPPHRMRSTPSTDSRRFSPFAVSRAKLGHPLTLSRNRERASVRRRLTTSANQYDHGHTRERRFLARSSLLTRFAADRLGRSSGERRSTKLKELGWCHEDPCRTGPRTSSGLAHCGTEASFLSAEHFVSPPRCH